MPIRSVISLMPPWLWVLTHAASIIAIVGGALLATMLYRDVSSYPKSEENAVWMAFELGYEFQRLLLAVETGESVEEIKLRGDIYLSRVRLMRDARVMVDIRKRINEEDLLNLYRCSQKISHMLSRLETIEDRQALLTQLRTDNKLIRRVMLGIAKTYVIISGERNENDKRSMLRYLIILELLMLGLLASSALVFDVTRKLRQRSQELANQLSTQDAILKAVDTAIIGLGPGDTVLYSNPNALALLGPKAQSGAKLTDGDAGKSDMAAEIVAALQDLPRSESAQVSRRFRLNSPSGTRHYVIHATRAESLPVADVETPKEHSHIVAVTDVTIEEEAALRREEYDAKLGEASRLLAFAALSGGIVHEISQPLAAMRNYAYALKVSLGLRGKYPEHLAIAERLSEEADRAIEVVRNIRRMGPQEVEGESVCDLNEAIAHSVRLVSLGDEPPPISVTAGEGKLLVAGGLHMIGQVMVNLLKNALGASSAAGRPGAKISVTAGNEVAEIRVADFGEGVSEEAAKTMFSPFAKSARGGMGLGLAICQRIANGLGGSLSWENAKTGGAIFKFTIPLAKGGQEA